MFTQSAIDIGSGKVGNVALRSCMKNYPAVSERQHQVGLLGMDPLKVSTLRIEMGFSSALTPDGKMTSDPRIQRRDWVVGITGFMEEVSGGDFTGPTEYLNGGLSKCGSQASRERVNEDLDINSQIPRIDCTYSENGCSLPILFRSVAHNRNFFTKAVRTSESV